MAETASRLALESALREYAPRERQVFAQAFLEGLSVDELLFLAQFLGSCLLITSAIRMATWDAFCQRAHSCHRDLERMTAAQREDADHKLILMSEFAACCGFVIKYQ